MDRDSKIRLLKDLASGAISVKDFAAEKYILIVQSKNEPGINAETTISPDLLKRLRQDFYDWGGKPCNHPCYIDENNVIQGGIKHRKHRDA